MFGTLFKFGADTSQFSKAVMTMPRDVARARSLIDGQVQGMNSAFSALGRRLVALTATFGGMYAVVNSFKNALDMSGRLNDMSQATGETAGNLAILERAFANSGVGAEKAGQTIAKVQKFVGDLGRGGINAGMAARALGITFDQLKNKTPLEQMQMLADGLSKVQDAGRAADLSMLIFGTRTGGKMTALLKNFGDEINTAKSELGSLPDILNKNAEALDKLGDKLTNSIGNKLNEFAAGALAGAQGANDFADALSKIDAAGTGLGVGKLARFLATNPLKALEALGNTLLSVGATIANEIAAQVMAAFKGLVNVIISGDFWTGVGNVVQGALLKAARAFEFAIIDAIAKAFDYAAQVPIAGRMFNGLGEAARQEANKAADAYHAASEQMRQGMSQAGGAFMQAGRGVYNRQDLFGQAHYAGRAVANYQGAMGGAPGQAAQNGAAVQITASKKEQIDAIYNANRVLITAEEGLSGLEKEQKIRALDEQYRVAMRNNAMVPVMPKEDVEAIRRLTQDWNAGIDGHAPDYIRSYLEEWMKSLKQNTMPASAQQPNADSNASGSQSPNQSTSASESTLQKAVALLEELNTKLPQPILA